MTYELVLGIEHLMTGVELVTGSDGHIRSEYASPSTMRLTSRAPFCALWQHQGQEGPTIRLCATEADNDIVMQFSPVEIHHFATHVADALRKAAE